MDLIIYQVDAFTQKLFCGNPAAVIPLEEWIDEKLMQMIAMENNLSETAFFVPSKQKDIDYDLRWFTPNIEIDLCGHATLASAFVIFSIIDKTKTQIVFNCKSGRLTVEKRADVLVMDFPSWKPEPFDKHVKELTTALGKEVISVHKHRDLVVELHSEEDVRTCTPDFTRLKAIGEKIIITAAGTQDVDFVSRFFAPNIGIDEDPVTGSAHSQLIPFWSERLNKKKMFARQLSKRGGEIWCGLWGDRVTMAGQCVFYMKGTISV
jgi:PhzF family phenazine biosynthesis protein